MLTKQPPVPELGPSLGRLTDPPAPGPRTPLGLSYDDIRLDLVTGIFDLAGAARGFTASGDTAGAMASLGRVAWLGLWERAVGAAAARLGEAANSRLREAAAESRFPARRLKGAFLTATDVRSISARLGSGGAPFVGALDALEQAVHSARADARQDEWRAALEAAARRLESAWLAMAAAANIEEQQWRNEAERVRAWRRPLWPMWLVMAIAAAAAAYLGLVVGGYLPVPELLRGITDFWWNRF